MARFDYQGMIFTALRQVVRMALAEVAEEGLEGEHCFYIVYRTDHPGVRLPAALHDAYPERMSIVLQHQFWELEVDDEAFSVTLAFNGRRQRLTVPFAAVESFSDPGAELGLRFVAPTAEEVTEEAAAEAGEEPAEGEAPAAESEKGGDAGDDEARETGAKVVRFDDFRKK